MYKVITIVLILAGSQAFVGLSLVDNAKHSILDRAYTIDQILDQSQ